MSARAKIRVVLIQKGPYKSLFPCACAKNFGVGSALSFMRFVPSMVSTSKKDW